MYYKKKGNPEEGEIVVCTVKTISYHSIFADLDEYENIDGMIHISEVAPGRIRNIRDYVKEKKKIVCQVLKSRSGQLELSLRRVPMSLKNKKMDEYKQEIKSEKLLEYIGKQVKRDLKDMYDKVGFKLIEEYGLIGFAFNEIAINGFEAIQDLKIPAKEAKVLVEIVQDKITPPEVSIHATFSLQTLSEDGIEDIKKVLKKAEDYGKKKEYKFTISYISAPKYRVDVFAMDYKTAEEELEELTNVILKEVKKLKVSCEIKRKK
jgi:translation initiation factor 2 subunit 1